MACRLVNLHVRPLRIELRGGAVVLLPPGSRSPALREELLYDNDHLPQWERAGWIRRIPARMAEVLAEEQGVAAPPAAAPAGEPEPPAQAPGRKPRRRPAAGQSRKKQRER